MTPRYGIDTSILVRLATGDPESMYAHCLERLAHRIERDGAEFFASNMVIGETYYTLQHHYGAEKHEAREAISRVLRSGLVAASGGIKTMQAIEAHSGPGLLDRLITLDNGRAGLQTVTLDRRMASLPDAVLL